MNERTEVISTNKIIFAVIFVCAALITSLFVFNLSHRPEKILPQEMGLIFPEPRDIKNVELVTTDGKEFTQKNFYERWTLVFFGFTHCSNICPASLDVLNKAYTEVKVMHPDLQVVFISLDPERDKPAQLEKYLASFNKNFIGASGKLDGLRKLQSQFGVYSTRDENSGSNYQLQHSASIFLINPKGKWQGMFNYGLKPAELVKAINIGINNLHS